MKRLYGCHSVFFFFKQKTAYDMRISDWSSDVCSSDLIRFLGGSDVQQIIGSKAYSSALLHMGGGHVHSLNLLLGEAKALVSHGVRIFENSPALEVSYGERITEIGRASCR